MYFKKLLLTLAIFFVFFKYNFAYNCLPCTCETQENSLISASCSFKTSQINGDKKLNTIPPSIESFLYREQIGELNFEGQNFEELLDDLSNFYNVEKIVFSDNLIKTIHPNSLRNLTLLRTLSLDNNQITEIPLDFFKNIYKIEHIFLNNNKITILRKHVFGNLPNLTEVHLNHNLIEHIEDNCFINVSSLKTLDLSVNNLKTLSLNFIDRLNSLVYVVLEKNPWICDIQLCDIINTSLERKWLYGRIPECFHSNGTKTERNWESLQILEPVKILEFQSPVDVNQTVVLTCQLHICSFPSIFWNFNGNILENSTHCIDGYKHTLTNVITEIRKDDEGLYTCLINNCSYCANSSRYLTVNDFNLNVETTTIWQNEKNISNFNFNNSIDLPDVKIPNICFSCFICLIIGIFIGIFTGIFIGIIIGININFIKNRLLQICRCCKKKKRNEEEETSMAEMGNDD